MNGQNRSDIKIGARVRIVLKADQRTGKRTEGVVATPSRWGKWWKLRSTSMWRHFIIKRQLGWDTIEVAAKTRKLILLWIIQMYPTS